MTGRNLEKCGEETGARANQVPKQSSIRKSLVQVGWSLVTGCRHRRAASEPPREPHSSPRYYRMRLPRTWESERPPSLAAQKTLWADFCGSKISHR